jgi:hypothetical protein
MKRRISVSASSVREMKSDSLRCGEPPGGVQESIEEQSLAALKPARRKASRLPANDENAGPKLAVTRPEIQPRQSTRTGGNPCDSRVLGEVENCPMPSSRGDRTMSSTTASPRYRAAQKDRERARCAASAKPHTAMSGPHPTTSAAQLQRPDALETQRREARGALKPTCSKAQTQGAETTLVHAPEILDKSAWKSLFIHAAVLWGTARRSPLLREDPSCQVTRAVTRFTHWTHPGFRQPRKFESESCPPPHRL